MKKVLFSIVFSLCLLVSAFSSDRENIFFDFNGSLAEYVNGCGAERWGGNARALLDFFSGQQHACNIHDVHYRTLGICKDYADITFLQNMMTDTDQFFCLITGQCVDLVLSAFFWAAVSLWGDGAFYAAQEQSRQDFYKREGREWQEHYVWTYGQWHPYFGFK